MDGYLERTLMFLDFLEKDLITYHRLVSKFCTVWSRGTISGKTFSLLRKHHNYGEFFLDYIFKDDEEVKKCGISCLITRRPRLEEYTTPEAKMIAISILLNRLADEYPSEIEEAFIIPQKISEDKKKEMVASREEIISCLSKIKKQLDRLIPVMNLVKINL